MEVLHGKGSIAIRRHREIALLQSLESHSSRSGTQCILIGEVLECAWMRTGCGNATWEGDNKSLISYTAIHLYMPWFSVVRNTRNACPFTFSEVKVISKDRWFHYAGKEIHAEPTASATKWRSVTNMVVRVPTCLRQSTQLKTGKGKKMVKTR